MINPALFHGNPVARRLDGSGGPCPHSPGSEASTTGFGVVVSGSSGSALHHTNKRRLEGVLNKYTNLLQGWQNRYFVLDPDLGQLQYFVNEHSKTQKPRGSLPLIGALVAPSEELPHMFTIHSATGEAYKLRASDAGEQHLWMSQLQLCARRHSESSAKGTSFTASSSAQGRTRSFSLLPPQACHHPAPPAIASSFTSSASSSSGIQRKPVYPGVGGTGVLPAAPIITITHHRSPVPVRRARNQNHHRQNHFHQNHHPDPGRLNQVKEVMSQAEGQQKSLVNSIESLPSRGPLSSLDQDLLLLKATSAATLSCLGECLNILQHNVSQAAQHVSLGRSDSQDRTQNPSPIHKQTSSQSNSNISSHTHNQNQNQFKKQMSLDPNHVSIGTSDSFAGWTRLPSEKQVKNGGVTSSPHAPPPDHINKDVTISSEPPQEQPSPEWIDAGEETTDTEDNEEEDLGVREDQRSIILHLLSQLKLGMDLTRVVLPTFILEKRSLLEMYANFMAHPDMFLAITAGTTPEERIVRFVEYYLTAFHEGRRGAVAKKPYNPILGESFRCSWEVPRERVRPLRNMSSAPNSNATPASNPNPAHSSRDSARARVGTGGRTEDCYRVRFVAEQVSHHPPVTGFYCECKERQVCANTHIWTRSKFMGMSIGVSMVGEGVLHLLEHDEDYVFTLPCAYARSILTVPWVELGGKVSISCAKSGYSATITFHTKPFYGGKIHRVTAEVKHNQTGTIVCKAQGEWNGILEFTYSSGETKVIDTSKLPVFRKKIRPVEKQGPNESRHLWQHVTSALRSGNIDSATEHKHHLEERQRAEGRQRAASNTPWKPKYFIKEGEGWVYHNPLWKAH
ncbi:oxysterol-binding protein-related protein 10 isoform X2 [Esox lucius]|uniref:Oxysterol-binding protein n=1 Tax=Esox lucius TaxID=8010 RepID=A0A3P8ZDA3_ESOLU|nr:oxysterol-binding protein-related protein 10 isoform X2 [Esox lucius]